MATAPGASSASRQSDGPAGGRHDCADRAMSGSVSHRSCAAREPQGRLRLVSEYWALRVLLPCCRSGACPARSCCSSFWPAQGSGCIRRRPARRLGFANREPRIVGSPDGSASRRGTVRFSGAPTRSRSSPRLVRPSRLLTSNPKTHTVLLHQHSRSYRRACSTTSTPAAPPRCTRRSHRDFASPLRRGSCGQGTDCLRCDSCRAGCGSTRRRWCRPTVSWNWRDS
jgi:hypothetical protein